MIEAWLQQDNLFIWLYSFASCGKSVLCSTAIQHAFRHRQSSADSVATFFFFTFNDELKQDASAALQAPLLQLFGQVSGLEADLTCLKESYNHGTPPVPGLLDYLRQAVTRCHHVYILLDVLDESPVDSSRAEVLSVIDTIQAAARLAPVGHQPKCSWHSKPCVVSDTQLRCRACRIEERQHPARHFAICVSSSRP